MKVVKTIFGFILFFIALKGCSYINQQMALRQMLQPAPGLVAVEDYDLISRRSEVRPDGYSPITLGHGVSLSVPETWEILGANGIADIKMTASQLTGEVHDSDTQFAANSHSDSYTRDAQYRVSFVAKEFDYTDLAVVTPQELLDVCEEVSSGWTRTSMRDNFIGEPECNIAIFNGKLGLSVKYQRYGQAGSTWSVNVIHIPLDDVSAMITTSYKNGFPQAEETIRTISSQVSFPS